ncbi:MAG: hypothetical protein ACUVWK_06870 [Nitrososphaerales archaeon]
MGGLAFWKKYKSESEFKKLIDNKLRESRSRGGSISLRNLGEIGFKMKLEKTGNDRVKAKFQNGAGNLFRSSLDVKLAEVLSRNGIRYITEPRIEIGIHAYYPDFLILGKKQKIIEVMGYAGDKYWRRNSRKVRELVASDTSLEIAILTSFKRIMSRYLEGFPSVRILTWGEIPSLVE